MIRIVTKVVSQPYPLNGKWCVFVESKYYNKTLTHILPFDTEAAANNVHEGYGYSMSDILREPRKKTFKAISVQQPFALLEVLGIKDVENRTWKTDYRGRVYIHACAWKKDLSIYQLTEEQKSIVSKYPIVKSLLDEKELIYSAIIGHVDIVDIVEDSSSVWALKDHYHWILANPVMFESTIVNVKGKLNFWDCSGYVK